MKILYHHRIGSKDGQYVHVEELTAALQQLGHEIVMVAPALVEGQAFGGSSGLVGFLKRHVPGFLYELAELAYSWVAYWRLMRAIAEHSPDCIYERYNLYLLAGAWARERTGLPLLLEVNAPLYEERKKFGGLALDRLARWSERRAWSSADYVLPVTQVLAEHVAAAGVPPDRIVVVPNGAREDLRSTATPLPEAKRALGLDGKVVLGFVGFVRDWHGLDRVVDLIADSGDAGRHLLIVGDGPARAGIERRAAERDVVQQVTITGLVQRTEIPRYVSAFDVALQPDVVPYASPLKLFEYMALGRAVIAPKLRNIEEVLTHEHDALLFDPRDEKAFLAAVERLCADAELRATLGRNAAATIAQRGLTWTQNAGRVSTLFAGLIQRLGTVRAAAAGQRS